MPRHSEKCYYCDSEYEIIYHSIDKKMIPDDELEEEDLEDYYEDDEPKFCPFCGAEH